MKILLRRLSSFRRPLERIRVDDLVLVDQVLDIGKSGATCKKKKELIIRREDVLHAIF